jgi:outer membrane protein assembly factor BamE (lipoprotein component of BamABCDE complex)
MDSGKSKYKKINSLHKGPTVMKRYLAVTTLFFLAFTCLASADTADTNESNEIETAPAKSESENLKELEPQTLLEAQRLAKLKNWRKLTKGISEEQVRQLLGEPKHIQASSHESIWYYQDLPSPRLTRDRKESNIFEQILQILPSRLSTFASTGGAEHGSVRFRVLDLKSIIAKRRSRYEESVEQEHARHQKAISKEDERHEQTKEKEWIKYQKALEAEKKQTRVVESQSRTRKDRFARTSKIEKRYLPEEREKIERRYNKAIKKENNRHDKLITRENVRYANNLDKMQKIFSKYEADLENGKTPISPEYIVVNWKNPDKGRINELLENNPAAADISMKSLSKWQLISNWRRLKLNMNEQEVYQILGEPEALKTEKEKFCGTYGNVSGYGIVSFEACPDLKARLRSWIEPLWPQVEKELCRPPDEQNSLTDSGESETSI